MKKKSIFLSTLILFVFSLLNAQDLQKQLKFANELYKDGEYYRAITEFKRINSYFPKNKHFINNYFMIASCYTLGGHELESINIYKKILSLETNNWKAIFNIAQNYNKISYFTESNSFIDKYVNNITTLKKDSLLFLSAINDINLANYQSARGKFQNINSDQILMLQADVYIKILNNELPLCYKSKTKGILLGSLIPGSGYFYANRIQTGFSAVVVNLLFGYATYTSFKNENNGLGITLGLFSASFYLGSIYGTLQAINFHNKNLQINFTKQFNF